MIYITKASFDQALEQISLVYGAVKAAGVYPHANNYEDYVQEGLILFAQMLDDEKLCDLDSVTLNKYIFKKILWRTTDELRKLKRQSELFVPLDDSSEDEILTQIESDYELSEMIAELKKQLTANELLVLMKHYLQGFKLTELAQSHEISYRSLSRAKASLNLKAKSLFL